VYRRGKRIGDTEISRLVRLIEQYRGCVALKVEEGVHMIGISSRSPSLHPALDFLGGSFSEVARVREGVTPGEARRCCRDFARRI
jgi:hypothetical protein